MTTMTAPKARSKKLAPARKVEATRLPRGSYNSHADLCRQWAETLASLERAANDVQELAWLLCNTLDTEDLGCDGTPSLHDLEHESLPAIDWQLRQAIRHVASNTPAAVELLLREGPAVVG